MLVYRVELKLSIIPRMGCNNNVIESKATKIGPYAGCYYATSRITRQYLILSGINPNPDLPYDEERQPEPENDNSLMSALTFAGVSYEDKNNLYGFFSHEQLKSWFDPIELFYLKKCGYSLMVYECDKVYIGDHQCIFSNRDATLKQIVDLETLEVLL